MRFGNIEAAYLLWLVPLVTVFYMWAFHAKRKALEKFAGRELLKEIASSKDAGKERAKAALVILGLALVILAVMRPQWGFKWEEIKRKGIDILIAIDTSNSMLAQDVKPDRLERSKLAVKDLIKKLSGDRIGLIAFAGGAFLQCPLTVDYNGFILSLNSLEPGIIPRGGTSISSAIKEAMKAFRDEPDKEKALVIITDGEDHEGNPVKTAEEAKANGIIIFCVGIGTGEGELIPIIDENKRRAFLKDREGNVVKTKLDEGLLERIALLTGGSYVRASGAEMGLDILYREKLSKLEKRAFESKMKKRFTERYQIPLAAAVLLLTAEALIGERRRRQ